MPPNYQVLEVPASSTTKDVIGAIVNSSTGPKQSALSSWNSNPNRWFQLAFIFVMVFGVVVYFREEIYTFTKDVSKHPILSGEETLQIQQNLGTQWLFGAGKDVEKVDKDVLLKVKQISAPPNATASSKAAPGAVTKAAPAAAAQAAPASAAKAAPAAVVKPMPPAVARTSAPPVMKRAEGMKDRNPGRLS